MSRPSPRHFLTNWRESDLPLGAKVAKAIKNNAKKALTVSHCCGNPGEPGC